MKEEAYMDLCYYMLSKMYTILGKQDKNTYIHVYTEKGSRVQISLNS